MGIAKDLKKVKMMGSTRNHIEVEGLHRLMVKSIFNGKTENSSVDIFAVEFELISTDAEITPRWKIGRELNSAFLRQGNQAKVYFNNIKSFVGGLYGYAEDDFDEMPEKELDELMDLLTGEQQAAAGMFIDAKCNARKDGKIFPKWETVPLEEQPEQFRAA